jgi:hypothetical protein
MNITNLIIAETIIFVLIAFLIHKYLLSKTKDSLFQISNFFLWGSIIILSILINTRKFVFFISTFLALIIISILFLIKYNIKTYFKDKLYYGVYMLLGISFFGIFNFVVTKYFIYNIVDTDPPIGDAGEVGSIGESGVNFFTNTLAERCYVDLINNLEKEYEEIKKTNKLDFDVKEYGIKNYFLKNNIHRLCYSKQFLDNFYLNSTNDPRKTPECIMTYSFGVPKERKCNIPDKYGVYRKCNSNTDCITFKDQESEYKRLIKILKNETTLWMKEILRNNCEEDIRLRNKLGGQVYETLEEVNSSENFDSSLLYNSKIGHQFLNDYFQNDAYLNENLNTQVKSNPFKAIKERPIWNWGISPKNCLK